MKATTAWAVLAVTLLVTAGATWQATTIEPEVDFIDTVPDDPDLALYRTMLAELDGLRFVAIHMPFDPASGHDSLRDEAAFDALVEEQRLLTAHLQADLGEDTFSHFLSVYEAMRAGNHMLQKFATSGNPPPGSYGLPQDPVSWDQVRQRVLDGDGDDVLAQNGQSSLLLAFLATDDERTARDQAGAVADSLAAWSQQGAHPVTEDHRPTGLLHIKRVTDERNQSDLLLWGGLAAGAVAATLLVVVRRPANVLIAAATLGVGLAWTFGLMGAAGIRVSFLTVFLAPLLLGVGIDYAVHLLHRYEEERATGAKRRQAITTSIRHTGRAVALAGITTMAGLAVLGFIPADLFAEIGLVAAAGMGLSIVAALLVTPALRSVLPDRRARRPLRAPRLAAAVMALAARRRVTLTITAVVLLGAGLVATQNEVGVGQGDNEFPADDPEILLRDRVEAEYGAFERGYLVVQGDVATPGALRGLYDASQAALEIPSARDAGAITDLLLADEATDEGALDVLLATAQPRSDPERLPATRAEAQAALEGLYDDPLWRSLAPFTITRDFDLAIVSVQFSPWNTTDEMRAIRDALETEEARLQERLGPDYQVAAAGSPVTRSAVVDQAWADVTIATVGATAAVGLLLLVAYVPRRGLEGARAAGLACLVVAGSAVLLLATVPLLDGFYQITGGNRAILNDMFLLAFAITVAVGVDDTVHLSQRYWEARDAGTQQPMRAALASTGRAITGTTLTTFAAFAVLGGMYFLQSKNLAILTALGVLYAWALTMVLVPAWLPRKGDGGSQQG